MSSSQAVSSTVPGRPAMLALEHFGHAAEDVPPPAAHLPPRADQLHAPLLERAARIGHQQFGIERVDLAQAGAFADTCPAGC